MIKVSEGGRLGAGRWVLGAGSWELGAGCWILDTGSWIWMLGLCSGGEPRLSSDRNHTLLNSSPSSFVKDNDRPLFFSYPGLVVTIFPG